MKPIFDVAEIRESIWMALSRKVEIYNIEFLVNKITIYISDIRNSWAKLYCLLMAPAVVGDMCDALASRPEDKYISLFRKEVSEVCRILGYSG